MQANTILKNEQETEDLGKQLAHVCPGSAIIFLKGQLGAGKTTLSRGFMHGLGVTGAIKSPTFTLVEPYNLAGRHVFHFDLYRLNDSEELEFMGIRDYFTETSICLIEWPERGQGLLPNPDLICELSLHSDGRLLNLYAQSEKGKRILDKIR